MCIASCAFRSNSNIIVNGKDRTFTIHLPEEYSTYHDPYPLLFLLHGNPSKSWQMKLYTGMNSYSDKNGFIVVYPDAIEHRWQFMNEDILSEELDYFDALLKYLKSNYNIDHQRIHTSGMSGGGIFSIVLAHALPHEFASIAVIAGNMIKLDRFLLPLEQSPIPLLLIHGTSDFLYNGTETLLSVDQTIDYWIDKNQCNVVPQVTALDDVDKKDQSTVSKIEYCSQLNNEVIFYKIENGGHHWPNSVFDANRFVKRDLGILNNDFDTNQVIWNFVSRFKK